MAALIRASRNPNYPAEIALVVSNRPNAAGLDIARNENIPCEIIDHKSFKSREDFEHDLDRVLRENSIEFICLAGFMRLLTRWFVERWKDKILNIHPSILPAFKGLHTHERAISERAKIHGASVHFVSAEMDAGPILARRILSIRAADTPEGLARRVLRMEHKLYPAALKIVAERRAEIRDGRCYVDGKEIGRYALFAGSKKHSVVVVRGRRAARLKRLMLAA
jgi:phosphoribosylglycinamide formyltransferase-1